jgi:hypothetical protein
VWGHPRAARPQVLAACSPCPGDTPTTAGSLTRPLNPPQKSLLARCRRAGSTRWTPTGRWACRTTAASTPACVTSWQTWACAPSAS